MIGVNVTRVIWIAIALGLIGFYYRLDFWLDSKDDQKYSSARRYLPSPFPAATFG